MSSPTTIILPVYADWPSLSDCLDALIRTLKSAGDRVLIVNDCGPDADELEKLIKQKISGKPAFEYFRNPKNLGFVGTCNRAALDLDKSGNDILLLNSDTIPTPGWLAEMKAVMVSDKKIAVVSPRSNNASIATIPLSQAINHGLEDPRTAFAIYKRIGPKLPRYYEAPVGIGYCMLIRRSVVDEFGLFDKAFGAGYGEEVDFCRRILKHGWKCAFANRAFVYHLEARSFTNERKQKLIESHNKIVWRRFPDYRQAVRDWMDEKVPAETALEKQAGIDASSGSNGLKRLVAKSPPLYRLLRSGYRAVFKRF